MATNSPKAVSRRRVHNLLRRCRPFFFLSCLLLAIAALLFLRSLLVHKVHLDVPSLCEINGKVHSLSLTRSTLSSRSSTLSFSILTIADATALSGLGRRFPSFLESRSIYASLHGYKLRTVFHQPDARRHLVWSKIPAIYDILFTETEASYGVSSTATDEWVWVVDLDTLIFNFNSKLESIVEAAMAVKRNVDLIIAGDHNGMNAGSFMVRRSEWTKGFLKRWWVRNGEDVPRISSFYEQAALTDIIKVEKGIASHVHIVPIRTFNSYGYPASALYLFQPGDFIVHCPGPRLKKWLAAYAREWERMMHECRLREKWMDAGLQFEAAGNITTISS